MTYDASELEERTSLNCKLNAGSEAETHTTGCTMFVPMSIPNDITSTKEETPNIIPSASPNGFKNLEEAEKILKEASEQFEKAASKK